MNEIHRMYAPHSIQIDLITRRNASALVGRNIALSVVILMTMGGTAFALPDWVDFYGTPSSGSLDASAGADIHDASHFFSSVPNGGFGPPTGSFQLRFSVVQPHPTLQFKDRWLFDYVSGPHHPHRQQHHRRLWVHRAGQWSFISPRRCDRCPENVRPEA